MMGLDGPENGSLKLERWDVNPLHDEATAALVAAANGDPSSLPSGEPNGYATFDSYVQVENFKPNLSHPTLGMTGPLTTTPQFYQ